MRARWQAVLCPRCGGRGVVEEQRSIGGPVGTWCNRCDRFGVVKVDVNKLKVLK